MKITFNENNLTRLQRFGTSALVLLLGLALGLSFVVMQVWEHRHALQRLEATYQLRVQERLATRIAAAEEYFARQRESSESSLRRALRDQVSQAMQLLHALYAQEQPRHDPAQVRRLLTEALRDVRFFEGRGYYFIDDLQGRCILLPLDPAREGTSLWDNRDDTGTYIMRSLVEAATNPSREGFARYRWYAPDSPGEMRDKLSYVELFEPYGWVVGAGDYLHTWEAGLKQQALAWLRGQHVGEGTDFMLLERGGRVLLSPGQPATEGRQVGELPDGPARARIEQVLALAARGGGFLNLGSPDARDDPAARTALVSNISGWDWVLVVSQSDEDFRGWLQREQAGERSRIVRQVGLVVALVLGATALALLLSLALSRRFDEIFTRYRGDLENRNRALRDSEGLVQAMLNSVPDLMWLKDRNGIYLACNAAFEDFYGAPRSRIQGRTDFDFVDRDLAEFFRRNDRLAIEAGHTRINEEWVTYPDGRRVLLETIKTPVRNSGGAVIGVLGTARDITARRNAERELSEARELHSLVVNESPLGVALFRASGACVLVNEALARITGLSRESLDDHDLLDFPLWQEPLARRAARQALDSGSRQQLEFRYQARVGSVLWLECQYNRVERNGEPHLLLIVTDISGRRAAQEQLRLAASVFEYSHEGITITDASARILDVNPTFCSITGYSREEVLGKTPSLLRSGVQGADFYAGMWATLKREGYWRGEIWNRRKNGDIYAELLSISAVQGPDGGISHYVGVFSDITLVKEQQRRLERMAYYDALTQLPNRALLADRMQQAIAHASRTGRKLAICYLDLDGFKPVNDQYGHEAGDRILVDMGRRLKEVMRADDTLARLGGDEFVMLLTELPNLVECEAALQRVLAAVAQPFALEDGGSVSLSASVGVTLFPGDSEDPDTLLRHADQALYQAKQDGRNCYHVFDSEQHRQTRANRELLQRLEVALAEGEFRLHYQPKVDMRHRRVTGMEALIRWQHPERGLLPPGEFLGVLSQGPLGCAVGAWVLEEAVRQASAWLEQGLWLPVSVNVSGPQLQEAGFVARLQTLLQRYPNLPRGHIELEILESAALEDIFNIGQIMDQCRELGVTFALDDFGTGYSTLTYLRRLPAEVLKVDQSFVRDMLTDPEDFAIVEGVVGLAQAFHRKVIAEGVESPEIGERLVALGCDLGQGYGIARPMAPEAVPDWVNCYGQAQAPD